MAKMIGYACALRLPWLNKAAQLYNENLSVAEYKEALNEYLSFEIEKGSVRLRKTRDILMNVWFYDSMITADIRKQAAALLDEYQEDAAAIHLSMIYHAYPVVADVCKYIGRLLEFQDDFTNTQLSQKLFDDWGERGTLKATCRRVTLTLKELGLLENKKKTRYVPVIQSIDHSVVTHFLLQTAMIIDNGSYYSLEEIKAFRILFPFSLSINKEALLTDDRFAITNFGGDMVISLNN